MPAVAMPGLRHLRQQPPSWAWPEFCHPAPTTIVALGLILVLISIFISILWQLLQHHLAQRHGFVLDAQNPAAAPDESLNTKKAFRPTSLTSELQMETRQLLFSERATTGERMPLCDPKSTHARGSLYDTFQLPPPHATRLKCSQSMMELHGGDPLGEGEDKNGARKAKTIHWHGVNRLNTAWAWMS
ncbi:hypothetical protein B0J13DRAFT_280127 [Dactylonectria estremocensis]|uniref:Uncharacterized protein n=1 Tax=Dactylonectria estremocensis TaxID=1079267 RepID=A0A9P9F0D4_9HYPO|nr:hypothetical protein B0J13DRAFT_280127 [Dactylonectria estremocensis]